MKKYFSLFIALVMMMTVFTPSLAQAQVYSSATTDMRSVFHDANSLTSLDLSGFGTSNVTNMNEMFQNASGLTAIELSPLPNVQENEQYTGKWVSVGNGTIEEPLGLQALTSTQLMAMFDGSTMADTWVWQRNQISDLPTPILDLSIRSYTSADVVESDRHAGFKFIRGEIIVSAALSTPYYVVYDLVTGHGGEIVGYLETANVYQVCFGVDKTEAELWELIDIFNAHDAIILASLNLVGEILYYYRLLGRPTANYFIPYAEPLETEDSLPPPSNDLLWADQWDDYWAGMSGGLNWGMEVIDAPVAWEFNDLIRENRVTVGVIDTGFWTEHEDLTINLAFGESSNPPTTPQNHGTAVSGVIGANADNELGIAGLLWYVDLYGYPHNSIHFQSSAFSAFRQKHALATLFATGANIINVSQGHTFFATRVPEDSTMPEEIEFLVTEGLLIGVFLQKYLDLGFDFVIVNSAGNESYFRGTRGYAIDTRYGGFFRNIPNQSRPENNDLFPHLPNYYFPDVNSRIIIVGSMDTNERIANFGTPCGFGFFAPVAVYRNNANNFRISEFSQLGDRVDILAPGGYILTASVTHRIRYDMMSGTSYAAPHVTGTVGMVWAVNPYLTGYEVRNIILESSSMYLTIPDSIPIYGSGDNVRRSYPVLNAGNAVAQAYYLLSGQQRPLPPPVELPNVLWEG